MRHCLNKILYSKGGSGVLHGQKTTRPTKSEGPL